MKKIARALLLMGTGWLLIFIVAYQFVAPQLRGTVLLWGLAIAALVGLAVILKMISNEKRKGEEVSK